MHLLIDVGNTRIKWVYIDSVYADIGRAQFGQLVELTRFINSIDISNTKVMVAAVNQTDDLKGLIQGADFEQVDWVVSQQKQAGVVNSYQVPERMGVDRWLAMIAAYHLRDTLTFTSGVIVIDAGSAMTIDVVDAVGKHLGGYIVPGLMMAQHALFTNTEQVIRYNEASVLAQRDNSKFKLGNNTLQCVEYGVVNQLVALITYVTDKYPDFKIIFSGGDGDMLASFFDSPVVDQNLVLKGLWQVRK